MNCRDARMLVHAWLDDELGPADSLALTRHLADCARCAQALRAHTQLRSDMQGAGLYRPAPVALRERVTTRLSLRVDVPRSPRRGWSLALAALAALCAIAATFAGWQTVQLRRQGGNVLVAEAVSDHVRSLMPGHLIDVRTSDQHTVKPWFDGRVGFSPQVKDISAQGFDLVGGRLDVLAGKKVAALVYKRRLHTISVFQWPGDSTAPATMQTRDGYHVLAWHDAGLQFVAVSSVAAGDLQVFVRAFRASHAAVHEPSLHR